ncbi:MAG: hypothetical protein K2P93_02695 [Alphaproteobacteria bacterium]|nr:hypothetical protein [Alphaproteobacteria bacterium]
MNDHLLNEFQKNNFFIKVNKLLFAIIVISLSLCLSLYAGEDDNLDEKSTLLLNKKNPKHNDYNSYQTDSDVSNFPLPENNVSIRDAEEKEEIAEEDPDFSRDIPILNINPNHPKRQIVNGFLHQLSNKPKLMKKLGDEGIHDTALIIYDLSKQPSLNSNSPSPWTKTSEFLTEFDKRFFDTKISSVRKASRFVTMPLSVIFGSLAPAGIVATTWYLWGSNVYDKLIVGPLPDLITLVATVSLLPPCIVQVLESTESAADLVFGNNGLIPTKHDSKPHIQKLGIEVSTCCKSLRIPTPLVYAAVSTFDAALVALPYLVFFHTAEFEPNVDGETFFYIRFIPFTFFYLQKTFQENYDFFIRHEHKNKTKVIRMVRQKKDILQRRLKTMGWHINSKGSDKLVEKLYELIQTELKQSNKDDGNEHISALSLLFLKLTRSNSFQELQNEFSQQARKNPSLEFAHFEQAEMDVQSINAPLQELANLKQFAREFEAVPAQSMANLIGDIDKLPSETNMSRFLKQAATWTKGLSTIGELIVTTYALQQFALFLGLDPTDADAIAYTGAIAHGLFSAFTQSDIQETTFLRARHLGSTYADFWPFRWCTSALSTATALFLSVPYPCIINEALGESTPPYVRAFLALSTVPNQFTSFYNFCHQKYAKLITKIVTTVPIKTTKQKRAWINNHLERMHELIETLDQDTTQDWYNICQEGI